PQRGLQHPPPHLCFFFAATLATALYPLSLHDALPIWLYERVRGQDAAPVEPDREAKSVSRDETFPADVDDDAALGGKLLALVDRDRKCTRLNSSHVECSYAVFCLKKKKEDD